MAQYIPGYGYVPDDYKPQQTQPGQRPNYANYAYDSGQGRTGPATPSTTQSAPTWREQLLPGYAQTVAQPGTNVPGTYTLGPNGEFTFNSLNAASTGIVDQSGNVTADIYYFYQPIGQYTPGVPYAGMGPKEGRGGQHLGALGTAATIGEALAAYWNDPLTREAVVSASRENYKYYPNWNPQWAEGFYRDIVNIAAATGQHPGTIIDKVLAGELTVGADSASQSGGSGGYGGGGGGYGGGGGGRRY